LTPADAAKTIGNAVVALQLLRKVSNGELTEAEIQQHQAALLPLATRHGLRDLVASIGEAPPGRRRGATPPRKAAAATGLVLPAGLQWPTETYRHAHRVGGENIVEFLSRVWLPLIEVGAVDLRTLRAKDPSAAKAIDNFTRTADPATGERRRLPPHLHIPTKKELNDRLAASIADAGDRPVRLDWALRSRARRAHFRK
jgi:hypothetical protein